LALDGFEKNMPELPEVETVARGLQGMVAGRRIVSVMLGKTDFIDNPGEVERELPGRTIRVVERYGKFMLLRLGEVVRSVVDKKPVKLKATDVPEKAEEAALLVHLGMTGMLSPHVVAEEHKKHTHVVMLLDDGRELRYVDPRRFGRMAYLAGELLRKELLRFGADPLEVESAEFVNRISGRNSRIKALLLDQKVLRGVGNIYADESLWKAKIHPAKLGANLRAEQVKLLYRSLQAILKNAIVKRGSSIADFLDAEGQPGEYQQHHRVYGREGEKCFRCGTVIQRGIVAGRSSFYCGECQKAPRGWKFGGGKQKAKSKR
jgi:formamidopyrimidine-DNA glycosylase